MQTEIAVLRRMCGSSDQKKQAAQQDSAQGLEALISRHHADQKVPAPGRCKVTRKREKPRENGQNVI